MIFLLTVPGYNISRGLQFLFHHVAMRFFLRTLKKRWLKNCVLHHKRIDFSGKYAAIQLYELRLSINQKRSQQGVHPRRFNGSVLFPASCDFRSQFCQIKKLSILLCRRRMHFRRKSKNTTKKCLRLLFYWPNPAYALSIYRSRLNSIWKSIPICFPAVEMDITQ